MSKLTLPPKKGYTTAAPTPPAAAVDVYEVFLKGFLNDGPRLRAYVYREAEDRGLAWESVKAKFADLHGREYVQKGDYFWQILPD